MIAQKITYILTPVNTMQHRKKYIIFMIIAAVTSLLKSLVFAKILNTSDFGVYSLVILLSSYILFMTNLGLEPGFLKFGAKYFGTNQQNKLLSLSSHVFSLSLIIFTANLLISITLYTFLSDSFLRINSSFFIAAALAGGNFLFGIVTTYARIIQNFLEFSIFLALRNFLALFIGYMLKDYSTTGILFGEVLSFSIVVTIIAIRYRFILQIPDTRLLKPIVKLGMPFSFNYLLRALTHNIDKWIITYALGTSAVGLYSFSMIVFTAGVGLLNIITQPLVSKWLSIFGKTNDIDMLNKNTISLVIKCYKYLTPVLILFILSSPWLIDYFFPKYSEAKSILPIISIATAVHMSNIFDTSLIAQHKGRALIIITVINFVISAILYAIGYLSQAPLIFYAIVFAISQLTLLVLTYLKALNINFIKPKLNNNQSKLD